MNLTERSIGIQIHVVKVSALHAIVTVIGRSSAAYHLDNDPACDHYTVEALRTGSRHGVSYVVLEIMISHFSHPEGESAEEIERTCLQVLGKWNVNF